MPRTQTSDRAPSSSYQLVLLFAATDVTSGLLLFTNTRTGSIMVVTTMDMCNFGGSEGSVCAVCFGTSNNPIFGGLTGAGQYDTFSWRGELCLAQSSTLVCGVVTGSWAITASGYYAPEVL